MAQMGSRGGKIGGKRRLVTMTPEQRSQVASDAAKARWKKRRDASSGVPATEPLQLGVILASKIGLYQPIMVWYRSFPRENRFSTGASLGE